MNELSGDLKKLLKEMREEQKLLTNLRKKHAESSGKATGQLELEKTEFISDEEGLIKMLEDLSEKSEDRFLEIADELESDEPMSPVEREEVQSILDFLKDLESHLPSKKELHEKSPKERLRLLNESLREITKLSKKFHDIQKYEKRLAREVLEHEISPLMKKIYTEPERLEADPDVLIFPVSKKQLRKLEKEAENINSCQDPDYKVTFRKWWKSEQQPETDETTPLKDPHINATIKLFGGPRKNIHLIAA